MSNACKLPSDISPAVLLELLPEAVVAVDERQRVIYANQAVEVLLGYRSEQLLGEPFQRLLPRRLRGPRQSLLEARTLVNADGLSTELRSRFVSYVIDARGAEVPVLITLARVCLGSSSLEVVVLRGAALLAAELQRASDDASTDALTGLLNRRGLLRVLDERVRIARPFLLLYFDLCGFKPFNDQHGHAAGDAVLRFTAERMRQSLRGDEVVARVGGDEFAMVLRPSTTRQRDLARAKSIVRTLSQPFRLAEVTGAVSANVGFAHFPADGNEPNSLLDRADRRMYAAKAAGEPIRPQQVQGA